MQDRAEIGPEPGRCSVTDLLTAALGASATGAAAWIHRDRAAIAVGLAAVLAVSTVLAVIDFREHRLPNRIVGPLAAGVTLWLPLAGLLYGEPGRAGRAIGFGIGLSLVLLVANVVGGLGMGDVKYGYPLGATVGWFGFGQLTTALFVTAMAGGVVAIAAIATGRGRHHHLSYGPYLALGLAAGVITAPPG